METTTYELWVQRHTEYPFSQKDNMYEVAKYHNDGRVVKNIFHHDDIIEMAEQLSELDKRGL